MQQEWRLLLFGFALMFFSSPGQTFFVSLFGEHIRADLDLSHAQFGLIYSLATLLSALCLLKTGSLIDIFPMSRVVLTITVGLGVACLSMALSHSVIVLCMAIFLLRHFGQGLFSTASTTAMMRYLGGYKGRANAFSKLGFSAAEVAMPSVIVLMLTYVNWRLSWAMIGLGVVLVMPLMTMLAASKLVAKESLNSNAAAANVSVAAWTRREVLWDPAFYLFMPVLISQPMLHTGFIFHQLPLVVEKGWSLTSWGALYSVYAVTTSLTLIGAGHVVDKIGSMRLIPVILLPAIGAFLAIWQLGAIWAAALFFFLMGLTSGLQAAVFAPFLAERYGLANYASIRSMAYFVMVLATALSPVLMGGLIDEGFSVANMAGMAIVYCGLVTAVSVLGVYYIKSLKQGS